MIRTPYLKHTSCVYKLLCPVNSISKIIHSLLFIIVVIYSLQIKFNWRLKTITLITAGNTDLESHCFDYSKTNKNKQKGQKFENWFLQWLASYQHYRHSPINEENTTTYNFIFESCDLYNRVIEISTGNAWYLWIGFTFNKITTERFL